MAKKKSKRKAIVIILILVVILAVIPALLIIGKKDKTIAVTVESVKRRTITQTVSATGKLKPETQVKISSETSGEIIYLGVKDGDTVHKGQLLVRIKPDLVETQLEQFQAGAEAAKANMSASKAELDRAQENLTRVTTLYKQKYASQEEFEQSRATLNGAQARYNSSAKNYDQALAALKQAQVSVSRTNIYAPMNGIVTSLSVEPGEKVVGTAQMQGTEIMQISDLTLMNALVNVDENDVVLVKVGDTAHIEVDAFPRQRFTGVVYQIGNSAITTSQGTQEEVVNFEVRIRIVDYNARFRPGMSCNTEIETETHRNVLAVPLQAVTVRKQEMNAPTGGEESNNQDSTNKAKSKAKQPPSIVFVSENRKVKMTKVKTGISDNGYIEITEGLREGIPVVTGSFQAITKELEDGSLIRVDSTQSRSGKK